MTWYTVASTTFSGTASSVPAGSALQGGWIDAAGNTWSISGGLLLANTGGNTLADAAPLSRPSSEATVDCRIRATFVQASGGAPQPYLLARLAGGNCYAANVTGSTLGLYALIGGAYYPLAITSGSSFIVGTTYILDFQVTGTTPTALTAALYSADGSQVIGTVTYSDSGVSNGGVTSLLLGAYGVVALGVYNGSSTGLYSAATTYTDAVPVAATYTLTAGASTAAAGTAESFSLVLQGTLASAVIITPTDTIGGAGTISSQGTFSPTSVTIAAGSTGPGTFAYTTSVGGTHVISTTNNQNLLNPSAASFVTTTSTQWYPIEDGSFSMYSASLPSVSAGTALAGGWVDLSGNKWTTDSSGRLLNSTTGANTLGGGALVRPTAENPTNYDSRIVGEFNYTNQCQTYFALRHNHATSSETCYAAVYAGTQIKIYSVVSGGFTSIAAGPNTLTSAPGTATLWMDFQCVQTNSTTTTLTATLYNGSLSSTPVCTVTCTDTTSSLQNVAGTPAIGTYAATSGNVGGTVISAATYTDVAPPATGFNFTTAPSTGPQGVAATFTVTPNGVVGPATTLAPSVSGGAGTFSPTTLSWAAGSTASQSFTFTPTGAATDTITAPITSGGSGLTAPSSVTFGATAGLTTLGVTSNIALFSPGNWSTDSGRIGTVYRQSWNNGAWVQLTWTASANPYLAFNITSPSSTTASPTVSAITPMQVSYFINGTLYDAVPIPASNQIIIAGITASASNTLRLYLRNSTQASRWNIGTAINYARVSGFTIDGTSTVPSSAPTHRPWGMIVGDSITEGIQSNSGSDNHLTSYSYYVAQCMDDAGFDTCISACGYNGWINTGDYTHDVPGYYIPTGVSGTSRWNLIDSGVSLLDSNSQISSYGETGTTPAFILINLGTNEAIYNTSTTETPANVSNAIQQCLPALRAAAPTAVIAVLLPFPFYTASLFSGYAPMSTYVTAIRVAVADYLAANPGDGNTILIDLGATACRTVYNTPGWNNAGVHPVQSGSAYLAPRVARALCQALKIAPPRFRSYPFARL